MRQPPPPGGVAAKSDTVGRRDAQSEDLHATQNILSSAMAATSELII